MIPTILMVGLGRPSSRGDRWYTVLGLNALCVAAFGAKSNVTDSKTVTFRQPWGYEWEQQKAIIFCGNLWNKSNWLVRQCKKLDHNRDLEIIKPVQHIEVDWEVWVSNQPLQSYLLRSPLLYHRTITNQKTYYMVWDTDFHSDSRFVKSSWRGLC